MHDALLLPMPISERRGISPGTGASVALHLVLALLAIWLSPLRALVAPPPEAVTVEIVTPAEFAALQARPISSAAPEATAPPASEADAAPAMSAQGDAAEHATPQGNRALFGGHSQ